MRCGDNSLAHAVEVYNHLLEIEGNLMYAIVGDAAFTPFNETLCDDVENLVRSTSDVLTHLAPRGRRARLNLIWKDFVAEQARQREVFEQERKKYSTILEA